jgi:hypothetical protein
VAPKRSYPRRDLMPLLGMQSAAELENRTPSLRLGALARMLNDCVSLYAKINVIRILTALGPIVALVQRLLA